jgi:hypothetical protein
VVVGSALAVNHLDVSYSDLRPMPLLVIAVVVVPLSIAYSAVNMMLMARAACVPMTFANGVRVSVFAQLAELLPIPGGAIVRGAALVRAGNSKRSSAELVVAFSILWIACGAVGAGIALAHLHWPAYMLLAAGVMTSMGICAWLVARHNAYIAVTALALRVIGVALVAWRFVLAFLVIGINLPWSASMSFGFATILGSAASLVPAGLGVSEGLSALIAHPAGVAASAAFLAAALSRLTGFAVNLMLAAAYLSVRWTPRPKAAHG